MLGGHHIDDRYTTCSATTPINDASAPTPGKKQPSLLIIEAHEKTRPVCSTWRAGRISVIATIGL
jgi:hypothetical protein